VLIIVLVTIFALSAGLYSYYSANVERQAYNGMQASVDQLSYNVNFYFDSLSNLLLSTMSNSTLLNGLDKSAMTDLEKLEKRRSVEDYLSDMMVTPRKDILSVYIITPEEIYRGGKYPATVDRNANPSGCFWYQEALSTGNLIVVPAHTEQLILNPKYTVFSLVHVIYSPYTGQRIGVIKADATSSGLESICRRLDCGSTGGVLILDSDGSVILSTFSSGTELSPFLSNVSTDSNHIAEIAGSSYICNSADIEDFGWRLLSFRSTEEYDAMRRQQLQLTLAIAAGCSAAAILAVLIFSSNFVRPLLHIVELMQSAENGNMQVAFSEPRRDEIGYLGTSFNRMLRRIDEANRRNLALTEQIYAARELQNLAELHALQAQIKPHFLCNALNMVSLQVQTEQPEQAVTNINRLSHLMRGLTNLEQYVPLRSEVAFVEDYLGIQSCRFGSRLRFSIHIEEAYHACVVPALTLQPIVENSIVHGCENNAAQTTVTIQSRSGEKGCFYLDIIDTGCGMSSECLTNLRQRLQSGSDPSTSQSVGLLNIQRRLQLYYGSSYGLAVESAPGVGTTVTLRLPCGGSDGIKENA
jgi:two-component system sensor histidine kinase YesM